MSCTETLLATPLAPWGIKKLFVLAKSGEIEAQQFQQLAYGRAHDSITDSTLCQLLLAINELDNGIFVTLEN